MDMAFPKALAFTLLWEGGKSNDPRDPGGRTAYGVIQRTYDAWRSLHGLPKRSVYLITDSEVRLYYAELWGRLGCNKLPPGVALMAFDIGTNMGSGRVQPWLASTAALGAQARIKALDALRCGFWRHLRIFKTFGNGWLRRETACMKLALSL